MEFAVIFTAFTSGKWSLMVSVKNIYFKYIGRIEILLFSFEVEKENCFLL